ncbi:MAG: DUF1569 domain-containing protein [Vicinamibacterales bacterium]
MNSHLRSAREAIEDGAGSLALDVIGRPVDGRWSVAEILEHLTLAFRGNTASLHKALESGEPRARPASLKQRLGRVVVVDLGYFPRVEAPQMTRPTRAIPADRALPEIRDALELLEATLTRVSETFGPHVAVANHPYFAGMTVDQWRKFHWRHTVHHMKQVRALSSRDT